VACPPPHRSLSNGPGGPEIATALGTLRSQPRPVQSALMANHVRKSLCLQLWPVGVNVQTESQSAPTSDFASAGFDSWMNPYNSRPVGNLRVEHLEQ